ncbi:LysR family transcriptional regulator [Actinacidiphila acidipaludis]|uniref:LysR family transcriptional regulator n=1 Tax=Actinacidiphila acidipaludis TaxID=2873382 RepID=A0ABS7QCC4_9ACTN|nr:LysR family transcriptional regulator [Streptomyces acidipaludis]MBY8880825.1 LysR family transcriptional regulator [Streptomyces acidipaludis]
MLDLARLRALHAVYTHGSVGAAAMALGYTPSAVSQQIAKLERETGTTLLERQGRGVALTDAAHLLVSTAQKLMDIVESAEVALEEQRGQPTGQLTMAAFPTAACGLMPPVLARLAREHPALNLRLTEVDSRQSVDMVARGAVDLAVTHDWDIAPLPATEGVERQVIGEDRCDVLVPAGHRLATRTSLVRSDVARERWICQPPGSTCHAWLVRTLREVRTEPDLAFQSGEYATHLALVAAGLGIALVPRLGRGPLPEGAVMVPLEPAPTRTLYALWRAGAARRPSIAVAVRMLREQWQTSGGAPAPASPGHAAPPPLSASEPTSAPVAVSG